MRFCLVVAAACWLTGCVASSGPSLDVSSNPTWTEISSSYSTENQRREGVGVAILYGLSGEEVRDALIAEVSDRTTIMNQRGHGVYVEYLSADGQVYMWYPYNGSVVRGVWSVRRLSSDLARLSPYVVCYSYSGARNPVTAEYNPTECIQPEIILGGVSLIEARQGDPFNLSSGQVPFRLDRRQVPIWPDQASQVH